MDEPTDVVAQEDPARAPARYYDPAKYDPARYDLSVPPPWPHAPPPFRKGVSGNPGGRPKGASPRAAALRKLARNADADGIGAEAAKLGESWVDAAIELATAMRAGDSEAVERAKAALDGLTKLVAELEPNVRKTESVQTSQRVVLRMDAPRGGPGARVVEQAGASTAAQGPVQDAPLPSLGAKHEDLTPPASTSTAGGPATDPPPPVHNLDTPGPT